MSDPDQMMESLGELAERDVDAWRAERIRSRARQVMRREASSVSRWLATLERIYARTLEPAIVFGVGTAHFIWAIQSVRDLFQ